MARSTEVINCLRESARTLLTDNEFEAFAYDAAADIAKRWFEITGKRFSPNAVFVLSEEIKKFFQSPESEG